MVCAHRAMPCGHKTLCCETKHCPAHTSQPIHWRARSPPSHNQLGQIRPSIPRRIGEEETITPESLQAKLPARHPCQSGKPIHLKSACTTQTNKIKRDHISKNLNFTITVRHNSVAYTQVLSPQQTMLWTQTINVCNEPKKSYGNGQCNMTTQHASRYKA